VGPSGKPVGPVEGGSDGDEPIPVTKLKLDLHDVYNRGDQIDAALRRVFDEAIRTKATEIEIIPGKGSGALKKRVLRFLDQKEIKALYHRVEKDSKNFGRVFVHFRWK
jgi:dsDNA-specific endonuclease/ATPase MutS2